jgi:hypothetical protein
MNEQREIKTDEQAFQEGVVNDRTWGSYNTFLKLGDIRQFNKKNILLVGGGKSPLLDNFQEKFIYPNLIMNIDLYAVKPQNKKQVLVNQDFLKCNFAQNIWDEVWALYSLPVYCKKYEDISLFYKKSLQALAPNGNFRAYPIDHSLLGLLPNGVALDYNKMKEIYIDFCNGLMDNVRNIKIEFTRPCTAGLCITAPNDKRELNDYLNSI